MSTSLFFISAFSFLIYEWLQFLYLSLIYHTRISQRSWFINCLIILRSWGSLRLNHIWRLIILRTLNNVVLFLVYLWQFCTTFWRICYNIVFIRLLFNNTINLKKISAHFIQPHLLARNLISWMLSIAMWRLNLKYWIILPFMGFKLQMSSS